MTAPPAIFCDTTIVGSITNPRPKSADTFAIQAWATAMILSGRSLFVPAIVDYEQRREHLRRGAATSILALDQFVYTVPGRYIELTDTALKLGARLWASLRQQGLPTADERSLDCDLILAAQVLDLGLPIGSFVVATQNIAHLSRVIACESWQNIMP